MLERILQNQSNFSKQLFSQISSIVWKLTDRTLLQLKQTPMLLASQVACIWISIVQSKRIYNQIKVKAFRFWQRAFPLWTEQAVPTKLVFTKRGSMIKLHLLWHSPSSKCICHKKPQRIQKVYSNSKVFPLLSTHSFQKALSIPHSTCRKQVTYFTHSYFKNKSFQSDQLKK